MLLQIYSNYIQRALRNCNNRLIRYIMLSELKEVNYEIV